MAGDSRTGASYVVPIHECSTGGACKVVSLTAVHAETAVLGVSHVIVTSTVPCFIQQGATPVALADGTDEYLSADIPYSLKILPTSKLSFVIPSGGSDGFAYVMPVP